MVADRKQDSSKLAKRIGKRIAVRRKQVGWTQEQLAERVRVDAETISRFERGANLPSLLSLERLASALSVDAGDLLSRDEPKSLSEANLLMTLMEGLTVNDRTFIINQVGCWVEHLRTRTKR